MAQMYVLINKRNKVKTQCELATLHSCIYWSIPRIELHVFNVAYKNSTKKKLNMRKSAHVFAN